MSRRKPYGPSSETNNRYTDAKAGRGRPRISESKLSRFWVIVTGALVIITITGVIVVGSRYRPGLPLEITLPEETAITGDIYVGGGVANPGLYPMTADDTIRDLLAAAGGATITGGASIDGLSLIISEGNQPDNAQKININRAGAWLLEALPGIGPSRAGAIIAYREENGLFRDTSDLAQIDGIGPSILENIEPFITVAD